MSETTPEVQPQAVETTEPNGDDFKSDESKRAVLADLAKERKERQALRAQLDEIEQASLTELEKANKAAEAARSEAAATTVEAFRQAAITFGGISEDDAALFLNGSDVETLAKQAARLVERAATTGAPPAGPRPDLSQGGSGSGAPGLNTDPLLDSVKSKLGIA